MKERGTYVLERILITTRCMCLDVFIFTFTRCKNSTLQTCQNEVLHDDFLSHLWQIYSLDEKRVLVPNLKICRIGMLLMDKNRFWLGMQLHG